MGRKFIISEPGSKRRRRLYRGMTLAFLPLIFAAAAFGMPRGISGLPAVEIVNPGLKALKPAVSEKDLASIKAVLGEAEGEDYQGMLAVAQVIRRRGSLRGVYGKDCRRCPEISRKVKMQAVRAWFDSETAPDITGEADVWGNAKDRRKFKRSRWFKKGRYRQTVQHGKHYFFKQTNKSARPERPRGTKGSRMKSENK